MKLINNSTAYKKTITALIIIQLSLFSTLFGAPHKNDRTLRKPKLILVIVVDQMRADYLDRFRDLMCDTGFRFLMEKGTRCTDCRYEYTPTNTAPGHSFILSGIYPGISGIISNEWYSTVRRREVYCVEDSSVFSIGIDPLEAGGRMSPKNYFGTTVGDQLKTISPDSKVIGIAIKDRGAILPAGKHADGAFWFDPQSGKWISSNYYFKHLPSWVSAYNDRHLPESYLNKQWIKLLPDSDYARQGIDDAPGEGTVAGETTHVFPHIAADLNNPTIIRTSVFRRFDALLPTTFGDDLTRQFAEEAMSGECLGQRGVTDVLTISFSSLDYCGHIFGPDSYEIEDMIIRLDRHLAGLFSFVDSTIGLKNTVIVLTADHGVCPLPEKSIAGMAGRINGKDVLVDIKVRIGQKFDYNEGSDNLLLAFSNDYVYLDYDGIKEHGFNIDSFEVAVGEAGLKEPYVSRCYTRTQIERSIASGGSTDSILCRIEKGFNKELSGSVAIVLKEYSFFSSGQTGTTHGTAYEYDTHVPLLFYGSDFRQGTFSERISPSIIAGTLCFLLNVPLPAFSSGTFYSNVIITK
jgi:predicted AlkP superfamily pyrophosphatase or phosphodiesterase